MPLIF